jgi:pentatricopeptide repeat protein
MDEHDIKPTSLTFIALLGSVDGPSATTKMMKRIETYDFVKLNAEVYNSAIYALRRTPQGLDKPDDNDWQVALNLFQQMRRKRIHPTIKTYRAVLQVLSRTGKVSIAMSLLQQLKNTPDLQADEQVWAAAINVCAQAGDFQNAIKFVTEMQESGCRPNLRHCSGLLKALALSGQDQMALAALEMMLGNESSIEVHDGLGTFRLPPVAPDLIALNTVIAACSKTGNSGGAKSILDRLKAGEFRDPCSLEAISPDRITYHSVLAACRNPDAARDIVKEVSSKVNVSYDAIFYGLLF